MSDRTNDHVTAQTLLGGRYLVESELGRGGMATVFKGTDTVLGRPVAVKVLSPQYSGDANFVTRFRREAQAAARLNHPNLVSVYDTGTDDGIHFIVMEYVEAKTLADYLAGGGRIMPERSIEIAEAVCVALSVAHAHGIIHRDIKPANIMITSKGDVKVTDFGIARVISGADTLAQTAAVLGTASYLSPEQAQSQPVDERSDIYSLGVALYEMVTGRPPFSGDSPVMVASKHVLEQPTPPSKLNADVSPELEAVIMKAMAKNPDNRYQDADEMRADLERARLGQGVQATPILPESARTQRIAPTGPPTAVLPPVAPGDGGRRRWWIPALIILLILAVLGGGLYLLASSRLSTNTDSVKVPDVLGFTEEAAKRTLGDAGFDVKTDFQVTTDQAKIGEVIEQSPDPESFLQEGETVTITVGKRPAQVEVPNLTGLTQEQAVTALEEAHLTPGTPTTQPSEEPEGTVVSQNPLPGEKVDKNSTVDIVLSEGPTEATVPDVVCESLGKAESELERAGFQVEISDETEFNVDCPKDGQVAVQDPPANSPASEGETVTLIPSTDVLPSSPSPSPTFSD
ncbi:MAG TPA: Stk1 family PASTA domain-containing Ser/Thr kinase [Actinomycetota bacterium]|nr:Stk1 family PASTA domain-containing Ser/Thr kinase [Actinomycetota bacterium]